MFLKVFFSEIREIVKFKDVFKKSTGNLFQKNLSQFDLKGDFFKHWIPNPPTAQGMGQVTLQTAIILKKF